MAAEERARVIEEKLQNAYAKYLQRRDNYIQETRDTDRQNYDTAKEEYDVVRQEAIDRAMTAAENVDKMCDLAHDPIDTLFKMAYIMTVGGRRRRVRMEVNYT